VQGCREAIRLLVQVSSTLRGIVRSMLEDAATMMASDEVPPRYVWILLAFKYSLDYG